MARVSVVWLGFFVLAFVNGALREIGIRRVIAEPWAHHLSAATGVLLFSLYLWLAWSKVAISSFRKAAWVGIYWLILTVLAETFIVSRMISKLTWDAILENYNLTRGNLWPIVLAWVGVLPTAILWLKKRKLR